ncbi:hypothetical protein [Nakamurella endophytica]|nr:hypothetical protein [Nakamurella endophytica]
MLRDTAASRSSLRYLAGAAAQQSWVALGGFTSVNRSVPSTADPDPVARTVTRQLTEATVVRFGAGDSMPAAVQRAWWAAMLELVRAPGSVPAVLLRMTEVAAAAH